MEIVNTLSLGKPQILEILKRNLYKKGYEPLSPNEINLPNELLSEVDLLLRDGKNIIGIHILVPLTRVEAKREVDEKLITLSRLTFYLDKVYLALPEGFTGPGVIDGNKLLKSGVGLFKVNIDGTIEEIFPPQFRKYSLEGNIVIDKEKINRMEIKINELFKLYKDLEKKLNNVINELNKITRELEKIKMMSHEVEKSKYSMPAVTITLENNSTDDLPSFFKDNPWVSRLRRRGKSS